MSNYIKILVLLLLVAAISCNSPASEKTLTNAISNQDSKTDTTLLGRWSICSENGENGKTSYNVCPEIEFSRNKIAILTKGGEIAETMRWEILKDTLHIVHLAFGKNDTSKWFIDSTYLVIPGIDSNNISLVVKDYRKNYCYNFSKIKGETRLLYH